MSGTTDDPAVLVVEDEQSLADLYAAWLGDAYEVRVAYDGEAALEAVDEAVDVALLDRRMPGMSGDEVLSALRERGIQCRVAMVTAVEPDFDIIEMGFDEYLTKPVSADELRGTVERLLALAAYDEEVKRLYTLASKRAALESNKDESELAGNEEYAALSEELAERRERLADLREELEAVDPAVLFQDFDDDPDAA